MEQDQAVSLDCWAIIEIMGHSRIAGKVRSENFGAACMIRVDVPEVEKKQRPVFDYDKNEYVKQPPMRVGAFTKYIGVQSIFSLTPVTEELARLAAKDICAEPVSVFGLESVTKLLVKKSLLQASDGEIESEEEDISTDGL